jgi:hydrogenase nickel incorporation protein HypB
MCGDCGCEVANADHFKQTIHLEIDVLKKNNHIAHQNHHWFHDHGVTAINLMSSPGSGKTALLERTSREFQESAFSILVGDQQTDNDATRLQLSGARVRQITTHSSCHLDASMIEKELDFIKEKLLIIENVGNLVCPSAFDLGESKKVALLSTTEGEDKPEKYPVLFHKADLIIITKSDLIPYLDWDETKCLDSIHKVNPKARVIKLSSKTGEGMKLWYDFLRECLCV